MKKTTKLPKMLMPLLLMLPIWLSGYTITKGKGNKPVCLEISGQVAKTDSKTQKNIHVYLIDENKVIDSLVTETGKIFKFNLQKNKWYSIRIQQPGYVGRLVSISTHLPKDIVQKFYKFHFDLLLAKEEIYTCAQHDVLDFPVAVIRYDELKGYFDYNALYTSHIKNTYKKLLGKNYFVSNY